MRCPPVGCHSATGEVGVTGQAGVTGQHLPAGGWKPRPQPGWLLSELGSQMVTSTLRVRALPAMAPGADSRVFGEQEAGGPGDQSGLHLIAKPLPVL